MIKTTFTTPDPQVNHTVLCRKCHFNLQGLSIENETRYNLRVVFCPKCKSVNPFAQYPYQSTKYLIFRQSLAAIWFTILLTCFIWFGVVANAMCEFISVDSSRKLSKIIRVESGNYVSLHYAEELKTTPIWDLAYDKFPEWWNSIDGESFLSEQGTWINLLDWISYWEWSGFFLFTFCLGILWALCLWQKKYKAFLLYGAVLFISTVCTHTVIYVVENSYDSNVYYYSVARDYLYLPSALCAGFLIAACFVLGMLMGRPIIRCLISTLLSPRRSKFLSSLWTDHGKLYSATGSRRKYA